MYDLVLLNKFLIQKRKFIFLIIPSDIYYFRTLLEYVMAIAIQYQVYYSCDHIFLVLRMIEQLGRGI